MRILPDNPNLDFLRTEAKQLLPAMRETAPAAALSDAQRAVAEQYGFRTWPELKEAVDRRRTTPPPAVPELGVEIADRFALGAPTGPMTPISYAFMGRRWRLDTDRGGWSVTPVFDWIDHKQAAAGTELRQRARAAGVSAPSPVADPDGRLVHRIADQNWRVDEWMDLGPEVLQPVRSRIAHRVGHALATIHQVAPTTTRSLTPGTHGHQTHRPSEADWDDLTDRTRAAEAPWLDLLLKLRSEVFRPLAEVPFSAPDEPFRICINDLNVGAVRLGTQDEPVLVHWDFAGPNQPDWEIAYVLKQWAMPRRATAGTARALLAGYRERAGDVPRLTVSSFWVSITGDLNWAYNRFCSAFSAAGESGDFEQGALRDLADDPLTLPQIERLLSNLGQG